MIRNLKRYEIKKKILQNEYYEKDGVIFEMSFKYLSIV